MTSRNTMLRNIHTTVQGGDPLTSAEQAALLVQAGSVFYVKKTLLSSAVLESAAVDLTGVSTVGELALEEVTLMTGSTGLAAGTNVEIKVNNVQGLLTIASEAVANLGANKTVNMTDATVTEMQPTFIEVGKKVQIQATGTDCTGSGTLSVRMKFRRLTAGATIAASA